MNSLLSDPVRWFLLHGPLRLLPDALLGDRDDPGRLVLRPPAKGDPYRAILTKLGAEPGVHRSAAGLVVTGYRESEEILRSPDWSAEQPVAIPAAAGLYRRLSRRAVPIALDAPALVFVDPPEHTRLRRIAFPLFTKRAVLRSVDIITAHTDAVLAELDGRREIDLVADFARKIPIRVISDFLGMPQLDADLLDALGSRGAKLLDVGIPYLDYRRGMTQARKFTDFVRGCVLEPGQLPDGFLSECVRLHRAGELTFPELLTLVGFVFAAGFETTVSFIANAIVAVLEHGIATDVVADGVVTDAWFEELLRYDSPIQLTHRTARVDTVVDGKAVASGTGALIWVGAVNYDSRIYPDPGRLDVGNVAEHTGMSFSTGAHRCLGAALAKVQGQVAVGRFLSVFPDAVLLPGRQWRDSVVLHGHVRVPLMLIGGS
ncbi:cytochrome P450 [Nocardia harenae]|uniref:cytochrome P450 n=1 Tax=Nocardia harenae TaxID=358707 RepID=UPI001471FC69|nr:cytochrome P450 [Nocardia harenae]